MRQAPRDPQPAKRWLSFLREAIAAMDFFTVPTIAFGLLYCFFVISHDCRRILHFNVTRHPTATGSCSMWILETGEARGPMRHVIAGTIPSLGNRKSK
jgi:hypothetical protein